MDEIKKSVLVPIIFFSWFKFPLTFRMLRRYLWQRELSEGELKQVIRLLPGLRVENELISYGEGVGSGAEQAKLAREFWSKVRRWRWLFAWVPFLREAFVANTLAYDNVHAGSDIDLFLIGRSDRLWTCRAALLVLMNLFNLRVRGKNRHGKFSPEFWVSDSKLNLQSIAIDNDYYLAFWLADLVPIWPGGETKTIWQANSWLKDQLPIAWRSRREGLGPTLRPALITRLLERYLSGPLGDRVERSLRSRQRRIISRNLKRLATNPSVVIEDNVIKLHFNDRRSSVRDAIEQALSQILAEA